VEEPLPLALTAVASSGFCAVEAEVEP